MYVDLCAGLTLSWIGLPARLRLSRERFYGRKVSMQFRLVAAFSFQLRECFNWAYVVLVLRFRVVGLPKLRFSFQGLGLIGSCIVDPDVHR